MPLAIIIREDNKMKVLYFIPKINRNSSTVFWNMLLNNIGNMAEAHILTPYTEDIAHAGGIKIHYLSAYPVMIKRNKRRFDKVVNNVKPDVIHIFGVWNITAAYIGKWGLQHRIPVIISPLKGFAPWNVCNSYFTQKLPKLILFQYKMIRNAHAIHVLSKQEMDFVRNMGWHPSSNASRAWNGHISIVQNPEETNETSISQTIAQMTGLYTKTIDSNPFLTMTDNDRICENTLLRAGMATDSLSATVTQEAKECLQSMNDVSWRRILLHAYDEKIYDFIIKGSMAVQLNKRSINIESIERFDKDTDAKKNSHELKESKAFKNIGRYNMYKAETEICTMIYDVIYRINHKSLCRRHLAELYIKMRFYNYNEHILVQILRQMKIRKTTARLMQIMGESLGLEIGFMPLEPINDKKTDNIRKVLLKSEIQ